MLFCFFIGTARQSVSGESFSFSPAANLSRITRHAITVKQFPEAAGIHPELHSPEQLCYTLKTGTAAV